MQRTAAASSVGRLLSAWSPAWPAAAGRAADGPRGVARRCGPEPGAARRKPPGADPPVSTARAGEVQQRRLLPATDQEAATLGSDLIAREDDHRQARAEPGCVAWRPSRTRSFVGVAAAFRNIDQRHLAGGDAGARHVDAALGADTRHARDTAKIAHADAVGQPRGLDGGHVPPRAALPAGRPLDGGAGARHRARPAAAPLGRGGDRLDRDLLNIGKFALASCRGIMPDGTPFCIPDDTDPPPPLELTGSERGATGLPRDPAAPAGRVRDRRRPAGGCRHPLRRSGYDAPDANSGSFATPRWRSAARAWPTCSRAAHRRLRAAAGGRIVEMRPTCPWCWTRSSSRPA